MIGGVSKLQISQMRPKNCQQQHNKQHDQGPLSAGYLKTYLTGLLTAYLNMYLTEHLTVYLNMCLAKCFDQVENTEGTFAKKARYTE